MYACDSQNSTRARRSALSVDEPAGTVVGPWITAGDVSPGGTLTRNTGDLQKNRSNTRTHSKLQSLFSLVKVGLLL